MKPDLRHSKTMPWVVRPASCDIESASCEATPESYDIEAASCEMTPESCDIEAASCEVTPDSCDIEAASCEVTPASCDIESPPCHMTPASPEIASGPLFLGSLKLQPFDLPEKLAIRSEGGPDVGFDQQRDVHDTVIIQVEQLIA